MKVRINRQAKGAVYSESMGEFEMRQVPAIGEYVFLKGPRDHGPEHYKVLTVCHLLDPDRGYDAELWTKRTELQEFSEEVAEAIRRV
jgi:hypothetical protein